MKGLGFDKAKADEITGLDVFSDLLSRLNGKSDEAVEGDRQARLAVKTHRYVEAKWGPMRFVRGGLLIGDELREESESNESEPEETKKPKAEKKSKKRKAAEAGDAEPSEDTEKAEKRRRKEERRAKKAAAASEGEEERKSKKKSKSKKESYPDGTVSDDAERVKRKSKKEKKSRSESDERCEKKDKTKKKKVSADSGEVAMEDAADSPATGTSTPTESGTGTSTPRGSRNFVRSRFIAQKRQAVLDAKALNQVRWRNGRQDDANELQIFMLKT